MNIRLFVLSTIRALSIPLFLYKLASRYINWHDNDNNYNFVENGESFYLQHVLSNTPSPNFLAFDIGANVGDWSCYLLSLNKYSKIHIFEPSSASYDFLTKKYWPKSVILNNFALGSRDEILPLNVQGTAGTNSFYDRSSILGSMQKQLVSITTIDHYCETHAISYINYMKIDVEGYELSVLEGSKRMLALGAISTIQFEYGGTFLDARLQLKDIWLLLTSFGYRLAKVYPKSIRYIDSYSHSLETYKYSNWIATYEK